MAQQPLFPKDYWSRPKLDPRRKGDPSPVPIYCAVGMALSNWERLEETLATMALAYAHLPTAAEANTVAHIFGCIEAAGARVTVLETLAKLHYGQFWKRPEISKPVTELLNGVRFAAHRRNEIAHGKVVSVTIAGNDEDSQPSQTALGTFLFAPSYIVSRNRGFLDEIDTDDLIGSSPFLRSKYRYTAEDVLGFAEKFSRLERTVWDFVAKSKREGSQPSQDVVDLLQRNIEKRRDQE